MNADETYVYPQSITQPDGLVETKEVDFVPEAKYTAHITKSTTTIRNLSLRSIQYRDPSAALKITLRILLMNTLLHKPLTWQNIAISQRFKIILKYNLEFLAQIN